MEAREATIEEGPWDAPHTGAGAGGMDAGADPAAAAADGRAVQAAALPEPGTEKFAALCREHDGRPLVYRFVKRLFDVAFSACVIAIGLVPCLVLSVMIVADTKGSPIYSQIRAGKYGRPFKVWKFRSMVADSDDVEKYLSAEQMRQWKTERKVDDDPRITRLGSVIRRFSLDELPNFLNVFLGQISVIGPRAITYDELRHYGARAVDLLSVPQGITGAWQTGARNDATFESGERQRIELEYVKCAGLEADARCFFATFGAMFGRDRTGR